MKTFISVILLGLLSFSFDQQPLKNSTLASYRPFFNNQLKGWSSNIRNLWLSKFKLTDSLGFDDLNYPNPEVSLKAFYSLYKPLLYFSDDKMQFIDIYSYELSLERKGDTIVANEDVDQGISLYDLKTNKWERILFFGPASHVEDVCWITKYQFILVGSTNNDNTSKLTPFVYIGDVLKRKWYTYASSDTNCIQTKFYTTPQYLAMHIKE
jgi:hypothetical protein